MPSMAQLLEPLVALERFAENRGSTFSASSVSMSSALRLPAAAGEGWMAVQCQSLSWYNCKAAGSNWAPLDSGALLDAVGHTILAVLEARQVLETSPIQRRKGLARDGSHGGEV